MMKTSPRKNVIQKASSVWTVHQIYKMCLMRQDRHVRIVDEGMQAIHTPLPD